MDYFVIDSKEYQRGRIAAQLGEPFDYNKSFAWRAGIEMKLLTQLAGLNHKAITRIVKSVLTPPGPRFNKHFT